MKKCPKCGADISNDTDRCSSCGVYLAYDDDDDDSDLGSDNETLENIKEGVNSIIGLIALLVMINITGFFVNCLCGPGTAGNGCRQVPKCTSREVDGYKYTYYSIPLCGGCSTSGCGIGGACWGEKLELAVVESEENNESYFGCSEQYYGSCLGCGYNPYYLYCGHLKYGDGMEIKYNGSTYTEDEEIKIKTNGCYYKVSNDDNYFAYMVPDIGEEETDEWLDQLWKKFVENEN